MTKVKTFEDLRVWQLARALAQEIFLVTQYDNLSRDYSLKDQMRRSSGSIMDNIAEGFERGGNKELKQFLSIAKGSAGELRSQLMRSYDRKYINEEEIDKLKNKSIDLSKQLSSFITYLRNSDMKGYKFIEEPTELYSSETMSYELKP